MKGVIADLDQEFEQLRAEIRALSCASILLAAA
jgi:hypothetical protein